LLVEEVLVVEVPVITILLVVGVLEDIERVNKLVVLHILLHP
jgi:hypothetical protein